MSRVRLALQQCSYLHLDISRSVNARWWRYLTVWFSQSFWIIVTYRSDRFFYLFFGKAWAALRTLLLPLGFILRPWIGRAELSYRADIGGGLKILHPSLGVVVSRHSRCGKNMTLAGGNCIGGRKRLKSDSLVVGNNVFLGANAVVLGPARIGDNASIGAGAVVIDDVKDGVSVVGVPARPVASGK